MNPWLVNTTIPHTDKVVNLSSRTLNSHELSLLQKGLNFCPTPGELKMGDLVRDLDYFPITYGGNTIFETTPYKFNPLNS